MYEQGTKRFVETPLSLALWNKSFNDVVDVFGRRQTV